MINYKIQLGSGTSTLCPLNSGDFPPLFRRYIYFFEDIVTLGDIALAPKNVSEVIMSTTNGISNMRAASIPKVAPVASPGVTSQQKISNLFQQIDSSGTGRITKAQFEQAFSKLNLPASVKGLGLEAAFSKLDPSGTGVVSKKDFIAGMESLMKQKGIQPQKQITAETKSTPATNATATNAALPGAPGKMPPPPAGGAIGNTINISA